METRKVKLKLDLDELPGGFVYPASFLEFVDVYPRAEEQFEPWGLTSDAKLNQPYSEMFGKPLVKFAQAWHEDMIACFVVDDLPEPSVIVINPWAQRVIEGKAEQYCMLLRQFPNFTTWFDWMRDSELVRDRAEDRAA